MFNSLNQFLVFKMRRRTSSTHAQYHLMTKITSCGQCQTVPESKRLKYTLGLSCMWIVQERCCRFFVMSKQTHQGSTSPAQHITLASQTHSILASDLSEKTKLHLTGGPQTVPLDLLRQMCNFSIRNHLLTDHLSESKENMEE